MSLKTWEEKVLREPGAPERVREIEEELRLAAGLTALREQAGLSQRDVAKLIGVSQPRVAAIERSRNVTIDVLDQYVKALGGVLEVSVVRGSKKVPLLSSAPTKRAARAGARSHRTVAVPARAKAQPKSGAAKARQAVAATATSRSNPTAASNQNH
jgi:transcriptional regulator with XRE-family HTH domain